MALLMSGFTHNLVASCFKLVNTLIVTQTVNICIISLDSSIHNINGVGFVVECMLISCTAPSRPGDSKKLDPLLLAQSSHVSAA